MTKQFRAKALCPPGKGKAISGIFIMSLLVLGIAVSEAKWFVYEGLRIDFLFFSDTQECEVENCNWGPEG
jgi:hypothetical protein